MKKEYIKPEVELVSLTATEHIATDDSIDHEMGVGSSEF